MLSQCPACGSTMVVRRLACPSCGTAVEGRFVLDFPGLEPDDAAFARAFLLARGNLRELERSLGLSYAALRGRLDALTARLAAEEQRERGQRQAAPSDRVPVAPAGSRAAAGGPGTSLPVEDVLAALEAGQMTVDEALAAFQRLGSVPQGG